MRIKGKESKNMSEKMKPFLEKLLKRLPDKLTGDSEHMRQVLYRIYGQQAQPNKMISYKLRSLLHYLIIFFVCTISLGAGLLSVCLEPESGIEYKDGSPYAIVRPKEGEEAAQVKLRLSAREGELAVEKELTLTVNPQKRGEEASSETSGEGGEDSSGSELSEPESARLEREIRNTLRSINKSEDGDRLILPETLPEGTAVSWEKTRSWDFLLIIPACLCALLLVYSNRYKQLKNEENEAVNSIRHELPEFMNKLVLLLNAGLVLTEGFERLAVQKDTYFYRQLADINRKVRDTKAPFGPAFREFAVRSGVKELVRLSNIINDNVEKGAELAEKLSCESEMLWFARKKEAEERGRLAETKMTFPLAILLLALVTVTVAPALMEM